MKKPPTGDGPAPKRFLVNARAQVIDSPTAPPSAQTGPVAWASQVHPSLEQACQDAFDAFLESGKTSWQSSFPPADAPSWITLHFERIATPDSPQECYQVTLEPHPPALVEKRAAKQDDYRKRYKNLLRKMNLLMGSSQQMCWDWDLQSDSMTLVGPQECILGYHYDEIDDGSTFWFERVHPDDLRETRESLQQTIDGNQDTWDSEYRCKSAAGPYLWIKQFGVVTQRREDGKASHMLGTTQLIEQRKKTEREKQRLIERYRAIADAQGDAVVRITADHRITYYNDAFAQRFLRTDDPQLTLTLEETLTRCPDLSPFGSVVETTLQNRISHTFVTDSAPRHGHALRHLWHATPIGDPHAPVQEVQISGRDVTALKSLEEALVQSNRENQAKDRFLAMISHDLKTPLNPILGFSEILMSRPRLDEDVSTLAERIHAAGRQLHEHIDSLLEISKMDPEIYDRESDSVTLNDLRDDFESTFALKAEKKGITFLTALTGPRDQTFALDQKLLRNVLNNLIDNAIKFTPKGKVLLLLGLSPAPDAHASAQLTYKVIDDGPGIPEGSLQQIFEPFVRVDSSNSRETEGAGLGLSICRRALEILGGEIQATPNPDQGMTFSGTIPVAPIRPSQQALPAHSSDASFRPPPNTRTLIVDDIKSNLEVLQEVLSDLDLKSEACSDGATAIELISEIPYDIVFLDIHMPQMNGIETYNNLRSRDNARARPYFVAVTADSTPQTRQSCTEAGIEDFITKPISRSKIKRVLGDFQKKKNRT
ncbi:ATP-binding protein [Pelagicoccus sp. SDUM812005]|uniref:ATP-binding protein n=1 Tax=Pelagicoccus sp. SDUM812005 TaxID=3041257 RepID=UPI00280C7BB8|nr:ATP-binding protein [Pelagicoccus sp. SDUM812005]MDQ8181999.1 ATP-binding protein [Pelagicoccus sp. SDUM812005]